MNIEQILHHGNENGIQFVRLQFSDIFGVPKNIEIPIEEMAQAVETDIAFDGSSVEGFARIAEADMYLRPDLSTWMIYPAGESTDHRTGGVICDIITPDGRLFPGDPRYVLKRLLQRVQQEGISYQVGAEPEFFLVPIGTRDPRDVDATDKAGYFDLAPIDYEEEIRKKVVVELKMMGLEVEGAHHECAPHQHEIDFRYTDALRSADNIMIFKLITKTVALKSGFEATFIPKLAAGIHGSGMHIHLSAQRDGRNLFYDPDHPHKLSQFAHQFIGGIFAHIHAITAITNPTINSYKRLGPGYEAPVYICWSRYNRSALIRIPATRNGESTRFELRNPDPSTNPYLALTAILAAGEHGVKEKLTPPKMVEENVYEQINTSLADQRLERLPSSLEQALEALEQDTVIKDALGDEIVGCFLRAKQAELREFQGEVTRWEVERYFTC